MVAEEKNFEYRKPGDWIKSRLIGKSYSLIKFTNGYGGDKPFFICAFKGHQILNKNKEVSYGDHSIPVEKGDFIIEIGNIIKAGNLKD